jgi:hypothetical protein
MAMCPGNTMKIIRIALVVSGIGLVIFGYHTRV